MRSLNEFQLILIEWNINKFFFFLDLEISRFFFICLIDKLYLLLTFIGLVFWSSDG
jgi:hypothetical protein